MNPRLSNALSQPSRRQFLQSAGLAAAAFTIVPRHVLGDDATPAPSEKLNIAGIGVGGMGAGNLSALAGEHIAALCDVDQARAAGTFAQFPQARRYRDFREMLEAETDLDAVVVATPDHTHAVAAMAAMKKKLHVYVQKPLTHSFAEARALTEAARTYGVQTQMGNQGRSGEGTRLAVEWIRDGAIGHVRELHAWAHSWALINNDYNADRTYFPGAMPTGTPPVPETLDWDLWLGPAAQRPYHPAYLPGSWRGWRDFGSGFLGDFFCHMVDCAFWALDLGAPETVEGTSTLFHHPQSHPLASKVHYHFGARGDRPPLSLTWYDGGLLPERPRELDADLNMGDQYGGILFVGDEGKIIVNCYGNSPRILPESKMRAYRRPEPSLRRVEGGAGGHERDWVRACKTGEPAASNFDSAGPLTELATLGVIAAQRRKTLHWDAEKLAFTNDDEATAMLRTDYREGWQL